MKNQIDNLINNMQAQNQQLQSILIQKQSLTIQNMEIEKALEELEKSDDAVYKSIGPILVKTDKATMKKELEEGKEEAALRIKSLENQEKMLKEKIKENQENLQKMLPKSAEGG